jgi:opacity protein-like surface antigen
MNRKVHRSQLDKGFLRRTLRLESAGARQSQDRRTNVGKKLFIIALFLLPTALIAQSSESAIGGEATISAGVEMSSFNPDWGCGNSAPLGCAYELYGPTAVFNFDLHQKYGIEGEARWLHWGGYGGMIQSSYVASPRYRLYRVQRFSLWGKVGLGGAWFTSPNYPAAGSLKGSYFIYQPGATASYRLTHVISVRADYEYQIWPSFVGPPSYDPSQGKVVQHASGLTPNGLSFGVVYRFLGQ